MLGDDSPTGTPTIAINEDKFRAHGAKGFRDKIVLAESLHNLKNVDPDRFNELFKAAKSDDEYMRWAKESYEYAKREGEERPFAQWHETSRFDQVLAGYLFAGDPAIPTMKNWRRADLPIGKDLRQKLEKLRKDLGVK